METLIRKFKLNISHIRLELLVVLGVFACLYWVNLIYYPTILARNIIAEIDVKSPTLIDAGRYLLKEVNVKEEFENRISNKYFGESVREVSDGVKHIRMTRYFNGKPVRLNVVELNKKVAGNIEIKPEIASNTLSHKTTIRTMASRYDTLVGINGGFFKPQTGVPLGTLMIDGKLYTGPIYDRAALGIFENGYDVARVQLDAKITGKNNTIKIDNINQPRMLSSYVLAYNSEWGNYAPVSPKYGVQLQISGNKIIKASANPLPIPKDGYVVVGPKSKLGVLFGAKSVKIEIKTNPEWKNVKHIISGGPFLVKNGEPYIDMTAERLQAIGGRNPRTAIGYTKDNDLILLTADGREGRSVGLTLVELANLMKALGCVNAINLDGGGSTVMVVKGNIVNHPHQYGGIALSNVLLISKKDKK